MDRADCREQADLSIHASAQKPFQYVWLIQSRCFTLAKHVVTCDCHLYRLTMVQAYALPGMRITHEL